MDALTARPRLLRWVVPLVVMAVALAGGIALATRSDGASPPLPPRTAEQLLTDLSQANVPGLSGTVVATARLGLPALPSAGGRGGGASLSSLLSGSRTIRVWYAGKQRVRLAVTGSLAEADLIRNGQDLWSYQSEDNTVTHVRLPAGDAADDKQQAAAGAAGALTPQEAARRLVAAITPTTTVRVERTARVAGRDVYQLRLRPKDPRSLIDAVVLAVDGQTRIPLQVQVLAKGQSAPAYETGFTDVQFRVPDADVFAFTPPPGAKVTERSLGQVAQDKRQAQAEGRAALAAGQPAVLGSGWTSVLVMRNVDLSAAGSGGTLRSLLNAATPVRGAFGNGRMLRTALVTGLLTDDGRLYVGAVTPAALQAAAAQPLSAAKPLAGKGAAG
jgi:outer membrane lipoprotein-sorting protein